MSELCGVCRREMGARERAYIEGERIVCGACHQTKPPQPPAPFVQQVPAPPPVVLAAAVAQEASIPQYNALSAIATVLTIGGILEIVGGLLAGALVMFSSSGQNGLLALACAVTGIVTGVVLIGFGQAFEALRDIARNTFSMNIALHRR